MQKQEERTSFNPDPHFQGRREADAKNSFSFLQPKHYIL